MSLLSKLFFDKIYYGRDENRRSGPRFCVI